MKWCKCLCRWMNMCWNVKISTVKMQTWMQEMHNSDEMQYSYIVYMHVTLPTHENVQWTEHDTLHIEKCSMNKTCSTNYSAWCLSSSQVCCWGRRIILWLQSQCHEQIRFFLSWFKHYCMNSAHITLYFRIRSERVTCMCLSLW